MATTMTAAVLFRCRKRQNASRVVYIETIDYGANPPDRCVGRGRTSVKKSKDARFFSPAVVRSFRHCYILFRMLFFFGLRPPFLTRYTTFVTNVFTRRDRWARRETSVRDDEGEAVVVVVEEEVGEVVQKRRRRAKQTARASATTVRDDRNTFCVCALFIIFFFFRKILRRAGVNKNNNNNTSDDNKRDG